MTNRFCFIAAIVAALLANDPCQGQVPPARYSVLNSHPTPAEFREEIARADVVIRARIALWTFETWAEFDNLKVTQLVAAD